MDEFIRALLEQVRCKKAKAWIAREITDQGWTGELLL